MRLPIADLARVSSPFGAAPRPALQISGLAIDIAASRVDHQASMSSGIGPISPRGVRRVVAVLAYLLATTLCPGQPICKHTGLPRTDDLLESLAIEERPNDWRVIGKGRSFALPAPAGGEIHLAWAVPAADGFTNSQLVVAASGWGKTAAADAVSLFKNLDFDGAGITSWDVFWDYVYGRLSFGPVPHKRVLRCRDFRIPGEGSPEERSRAMFDAIRDYHVGSSSSPGTKTLDQWESIRFWRAAVTSKAVVGEALDSTRMEFSALRLIRVSPERPYVSWVPITINASAPEAVGEKLYLMLHYRAEPSPNGRATHIAVEFSPGRVGPSMARPGGQGVLPMALCAKDR